MKIYKIVYIYANFIIIIIIFHCIGSYKWALWGLPVFEVSKSVQILLRPLYEWDKSISV